MDVTIIDVVADAHINSDGIVFIGTTNGLFKFHIPQVVANEPSDVPSSLEISPAYPNPFSNKTTFSIYLARTTHVRASVYDILGREIAALKDEVLPEGTHYLNWQPKQNPSGVYLLKTEIGGQINTQRLTFTH